MKISYICTSTVLTSLLRGGDASGASNIDEQGLGKAGKASKKKGRDNLDSAIDAISPATTYRNLPKQCRGLVPGMLGEFRFAGVRMIGAPAADINNIQSWDEFVNKNEITGVETVSWVDGPYYLLAVHSPAGLGIRLCTFDAKDYRTSVCSGLSPVDESMTETLYVTETDEDCNAMSFTITLTKAWTPDDTPIGNTVVDHVQGVRTSFEYPKTPGEARNPPSVVA